MSAAVQKFFFDLADSSNRLLDPEGQLVSLDSVPGVALAQARDCIAGDVMTGRLDLHYRIEVRDKADKLVHTLSFADAVEVLPPR